MKTMQKGFTLIELMIVVAIIGILAAIAIPAYQNYTKRAHVSEGLTLAASAKAAVTEFTASNNAYPTDNATAGLAAATDIKGKAVTSVGVGNNGVITVTYNSYVDATNNKLTLTPTSENGSITWACTKAASNGVDAKFLPSNCR